MRRAIALFVEDKPHLLIHSRWLHQSWSHIGCEDTDLVFMGTRSALEKLPPDVIRIEQRPVTDDPGWLNYGYVNSIACLDHPSAAVLNDYDMVLRSDVDTLLTRAWNCFHPTELTTGRGAYSNDDKVRENVTRIASKFGYTHRGVTNVGSTIYGPPRLVRDICRLATDLTRYIRTVEFGTEKGQWPSWYWGVSTLYATEIAVNHLVPSFRSPSRELLDYVSTSTERVDGHPHIHCWHTSKFFSKFEFHKGAYDHIEERSLDLDVVSEYCLSMALRARR